MGMSQNYGPIDDDEVTATIHRALDLGVNFFDTADLYGDGANEELIGETLGARRDEVILATKFGRTRRPDGGLGPIVGSAEYVHQACDASLKRLGVDYIDLYYQHRVDPSVPIEETWGALAQLVEAGKIRFLGISEASPATFRRAHAVHPIAAGQYEYSLFTRDIEDEVLPALRALDIGLVCYSPLGRGFLTSAIASTDQLSADDSRLGQPRFQGENFNHNRFVINKLGEFAESKGVTTSQLALAWALAQGEDIVPIPGTKRRSYLEQNVEAESVVLTAEDIAMIESLAPKGFAAGDPNTPSQMATTNI
jgi:aryl-alcohol dehydrogenase-like predicted oxidoreductase